LAWRFSVFKIRVTIPELEKIPAEQRENFLRQCDETAEMHRLRTRSLFLTRACLLCAVGVPILLNEIYFHWHLVILITVGTVFALVVLFAFAYVTALWQARIVRRCVIQELSASGSARES